MKNKISIPWWKPQIGKKEKELVMQVLDSSYPNEGELTSLFEKKIAELLKCKHAVAVTSGTAAIFLALKAAGVKHGDEVIVPDITFIATANAVEMAGARPVLVDIDQKTMNISPKAFESAITEKTKAVVPVHVSGRAADMQSIMKIAKAGKIEIVEDAAEGFMSKYKGKYLGTFGKFGCFSFSPNKTITTGQGGVIVTDDSSLHVKLRELKDHGRPVKGTGGDDIHHSIGYNFKFTDLQAAVGLGQLNYLDERLERARNTYKLYSEELGGVSGFDVFDFDIKNGEQPQWTDAIAEKRDELDNALRNSGIDCRRYWFPIHAQAPYKSGDESFPNSTSMSPKALWLPSAYTMKDEDVLEVCGKIKEFFGRI